METHFPEEAFDKRDAVKELAEALYNKHREIIMDEMPDRVPMMWSDTPRATKRAYRGMARVALAKFPTQTR